MLIDQWKIGVWAPFFLNDVYHESSTLSFDMFQPNPTQDALSAPCVLRCSSGRFAHPKSRRCRKPPTAPVSWCATWCDLVAGFCLDMLLDGLVAISRWIETRIAKSIQKFREGVDDVAGCLDEFLLEHGLMACLFVHPFISMHTMLVLCSVIVSLSVDSSTCTDALSLGIFGSVEKMALKRIWI